MDSNDTLSRAGAAEPEECRWKPAKGLCLTHGGKPMCVRADDHLVCSAAGASREERAAEPLPMVLHCPGCGKQHIDEPQPDKGWENPPHRSHECQGCGIVWRPADVPTTGVASVQTKGSRDSWLAPPAPETPPRPLEAQLREHERFQRDNLLQQLLKLREQIHDELCPLDENPSDHDCVSAVRAVLAAQPNAESGAGQECPHPLNLCAECLEHLLVPAEAEAQALRKRCEWLERENAELRAKS
jgi:hypothetical protein